MEDHNAFAPRALAVHGPDLWVRCGIRGSVVSESTAKPSHAHPSRAGKVDDMPSWVGQGRPFSYSGNPDFIDLEARHPSAEAQEHVAARFRSNDEELTAKEREEILHPSLWRRFKQFWGWR